jgi:hypothetical protein
MYAAVLALRAVVEGQLPVTALFALSAAGAIVYFAVVALISRRHLVNARSFARSLFGREAPKSA